MTKEEKEFLKSLKAKPEADRTDDEKVELERLEEQIAMQEGLKQAFQTFLKDSNLLKAVNNIETDAKEKNMLNPGYAFHSQLIGIKRGDAAMIKAADPMTEGVSADGGYLVPALTEENIIEKIPTFGQARRYMTVLPISGNTINMPRELALPTWYWVGENAQITASKPTLDNQQLIPKKGAAIVVLSNELLRDANVNIGNYIIKKIAQVRGTAEDVQFFNGSGSPFTGVFAATNTFGNTVTFAGNGTTVTYDNLVDIMEGVDESFLSGASWFYSRGYSSTLRKLKDTQNRPLWIPAEAGNPSTIFDYPAVKVENAPSTATSSGKPGIILGNLTNSIIGDISGMEVTLLKEATISGTSLAEYDLSAIRVISRVAFNAGLTSTYSMGRQAV